MKVANLQIPKGHTAANLQINKLRPTYPAPRTTIFIIGGVPLAREDTSENNLV